MPDWIVPLADVRLSEEDVQAVASVYRGGWLSQGPRVAEFERAFAGFVGARAAIAVASGTAALQLGLTLLDLQPGDEVILPSLTFAATAATIVRAGAPPVFADVRATNAPWLSCERARESIGPRTRAIINVAYAGHPGETLALAELAAERGLALIEDAAHAAGAWAGEATSARSVGLARSASSPTRICRSERAGCSSPTTSRSPNGRACFARTA